jgi:TetR/AcrR family transcriptional repressor of mexJK operon
MARETGAVKPTESVVKKVALRGDLLATGRMLDLIAAAEDIFLAKGYHSATMSDVAKAAGMSKKTVYQMVESKAELFGILLAHYQSLLEYPEKKPDWTARDVLIQNLLSLARFLLSSPQIAIIRLIMAEYTHSPDLGRLFHQKRLIKAKTRLEHCLLEVALCDGMTAADAREMAAMLFGMALGEFYLGVLIGFRKVPTRPVLEQRVSHAVDMFMNGRGLNIFGPHKVKAKAKVKV